jgi:hypothetical protein
MIGGLAGLIGLRLALIAAAALTLVIFFLAPGMTASPAMTAASHRPSLTTRAGQGPG